MAEATMKKQIPACAGWFTMPPEKPALMGSKCPSCGRVFFPKAKICRNPYCSREKPMEDILFGQKGKLFVFTTNYYKPPAPFHSTDPFTPYSNGWIDLPEGLMVQAMIAPGFDQTNLKIGQDVELIIDRLYIDENGNDIMSYKYRPVGVKPNPDK